MSVVQEVDERVAQPRKPAHKGIKAAITAALCAFAMAIGVGLAPSAAADTDGLDTAACGVTGGSGSGILGAVWHNQGATVQVHTVSLRNTTNRTLTVYVRFRESDVTTYLVRGYTLYAGTRKTFVLGNELPNSGWIKENTRLTGTFIARNGSCETSFLMN